MSAQLELFAIRTTKSVRPTRPVDPIAGFVPREVTRNDPYRPFDGAKARQTLLDLCAQAGANWTACSTFCRAVRMYPSDCARLASRMVEAGLIEETHLYYGSSWPGDKDYRGFDYGYRLPQAAEVSTP